MRLLGDGCIVALVDDAGAWEEHCTAHARDPEIAELLLASVRAIPVGKPGTGLAATVARTGEPILIAEVDLEALAARADGALGPAVLAIKPRSYLPRRAARGARQATRCGRGHAVRGRDAVAFDRDDLVFARNIADHAALAIANAKLVARLQRELEAREQVEERSRIARRPRRELDRHDRARRARRPRQVRQRRRPRTRRHRAGARRHRDDAVRLVHTEDGLKRGDIIRETGSWQGKGVLRHFVTGEAHPPRR